MVALPTRTFYPFFDPKKIFDLFFSKDNMKAFEKFLVMISFEQFTS